MPPPACACQERERAGAVSAVMTVSLLLNPTAPSRKLGQSPGRMCGSFARAEAEADTTRVGSRPEAVVGRVVGIEVALVPPVPHAVTTSRAVMIANERYPQRGPVRLTDEDREEAIMEISSHFKDASPSKSKHCEA